MEQQTTIPVGNQIRTTCFEMLAQRGYEITKDSPSLIIGRRKIEGDTIPKNRKGKRDKPLVTKYEKIVVFTEPIPKFNIERVHQYITSISELKINHAIIIYSESATPMAKNIVESAGEKKIELFHVSELYYNITKHRFACPHIRLSKKEALVFKKTYGVKHATLLTSDAIAKFYNFSRGDVIKIVRRGGYVGWRIVR
jgi:DNA-directed RNA polymerase subunit H (RpoH/RPB5)